VAEAFSWFGTAISIGISGGSLVGGLLIDSGSWRWSALLGVALVAVGAGVTALRVRTLAPPEPS
jgi:predicted MFS family arabinose efflux permease